jgi:hypothetical protein
LARADEGTDADKTLSLLPVLRRSYMIGAVSFTRRAP